MKEMDKRVIDKGFHTGYEVDYVVIQERDYEYLKEQARQTQEFEQELERLENQVENWQKGRYLAVSTIDKERELKKRVRELESFKNSVEYTVDSVTLELIIKNQDNDSTLSLSETYDEKIYLLQKRVQELERELEEHKSKFTVKYTMSLRKRNKRYREYLELIKTTGTYGKDISTGEILRTYEANLADEALEGEE